MAQDEKNQATIFENKRARDHHKILASFWTKEMSKRLWLKKNNRLEKLAVILDNSYETCTYIRLMLLGYQPLPKIHNLVA
ncbi:hypothetical protein IHE45_18G024600 [Dioscorea alata]|uniref:Uncharacterized protein n=1 Tax=Dioscorea alata TaxID=55571 RepID=A0ACB7U5L9_DIOAL|nr:hypothetical protein IHE45_18G024600 [Dioscorea alata]